MMVTWNCQMHWFNHWVWWQLPDHLKQRLIQSAVEARKGCLTTWQDCYLANFALPLNPLILETGKPRSGGRASTDRKLNDGRPEALTCSFFPCFSCKANYLIVKWGKLDPRKRRPHPWMLTDLSYDHSKSSETHQHISWPTWTCDESVRFNYVFHCTFVTLPKS